MDPFRRATYSTAAAAEATSARRASGIAGAGEGVSGTAADFGFETVTRDGAARTGRLTTPHGTVATPAFVAVGTQATVKSVPPEAVAATGTELLFANTYHLYLRPGAATVAAHGGLHRFMNHHGPILTDSGGFQVFSLGASIEHG